MEMDTILTARQLCKHYKDFSLDKIDLELPRGMVMGLVGANGAGKTTLIKLLLGLTSPDGGSVQLLGGTPADSTLRERVGVVFDELALPGGITAVQAGKVMAGIYKNWDAARYAALVKQLELPPNKSNKDFSRGMKMKLAIALAMSHNAELLLLDEPTGGLDPLVRSEILDIFREFMQDERHSILISSHITSDLARIADYITYIDRGRLLLTEEKDRLIEEYGVIKGRRSELAGLDTDGWVGLQTTENGFEALVTDRAAVAKQYPQLVVNSADLDEVMSFIVREARK